MFMRHWRQKIQFIHHNNLILLLLFKIPITFTNITVIIILIKKTCSLQNLTDPQLLTVRVFIYSI